MFHTLLDDKETILKNPRIRDVMLDKDVIRFITYSGRNCWFRIQISGSDCVVWQDTRHVSRHIRKEVVRTFRSWMNNHQLTSLFYISPYDDIHEDEIFESFGLMKIPDEWKAVACELLTHYHQKSIFCWEEESGKFIRQLKQYEQYKTIFETYFANREDVIVKPHFQQQPVNHSHEDLIIKKQINAYFKGKMHSFFLAYKSQEWGIEDSDGQWLPTPTTETLVEQLDTWFLTKEKSQRLIHLYEPPKEGFQKWIRATIGRKIGRNSKQDMIDTLWKHLEKKPALVDFDTYVMKKDNFYIEHEEFSNDQVFLIFLPFYNDFIVLDSDKPKELYVTKQFQRAKNAFIQRKMHILQKKFESHIAFSKEKYM